MDDDGTKTELYSIIVCWGSDRPLRNSKNGSVKKANLDFIVSDTV